MKRVKRRLGQILIDAGLIDENKLREAIRKGKPLTEALVELGYLTESQIASAISKEMHIPYVDLANYEINPSAAISISEDLALRYIVLPIDYEDKKLVVAMFDPSNIFTIDDLRIITGYEIKPVITTETDILNAISEVYKLDAHVNDMVDDTEEEEAKEEAEEDIKVTDKSSPVVKMIDSLLIESVHKRAGDIHIEPQEDEMKIRFRIDGVLHDITTVPKKMQASIISRLKIMGGMDIAERRLPQDGRFGLKIERKKIDFRAATLPTVYGEKLVLRLLEKESIMIELDNLGLNKSNSKLLKKSLKKPYGAILATGPTGCGKTTTLYASLNILNEIEKNLITIEDPVEYRVEGINQVQTNLVAGLNFAAGLRSILRHNPDIVMIGEIRDKETAKIAIESALTGHLVLSTLHTNSAPGTLTRLIEMNVEPFLIASAIDCIIAQRLARKLCKNCAESYKPSEKALKDASFNLKGKLKFYRAVGCKRCANTGYRGRVGLFQVLRMNSELEKLTAARETGDKLTEAAKKSGMNSLREDGFLKVAEGITTIEEILRITV